MFIRIFSDSLQFSAENSTLPLTGELGVDDRWITFGEFNTPSILEFSSRVAAQEDIWILDNFLENGTLNGSVPSFIRNHAVIGQVKSLYALRKSYGAEENEAMLAVMNEELDVNAPQSYKDSVLFFSRWWEKNNPTLSTLRGAALAFLTQDAQIADMPYLQLMGYNEEVARNIDPSIQEYVPEQSMKFVRCEAHAKSLIAHVNVAVSCALDTPQPVTITVGGEHITVVNKRISLHIRGLFLELPTGGNLFYRDATFKEGSMHFAGKRVSNKSITLAIINRTADDLLWSDRAKSIGMELTPAIEASRAFQTPSNSPGIGGTLESRS